MQLVSWVMILPMLRWRYAVRYGKIGVAEVLKVRIANRSTNAFYETSGTWIVATRDRQFRASFKNYDDNSKSWWYTLDVGARILILGHPAKPEVVVALGPIDVLPAIDISSIVQHTTESADRNHPDLGSS